MGRQVKTTIDYFPHNYGIRNDIRFKMIFHKLRRIDSIMFAKATVYGVVNMIFESMCEKGLKIELNKKEFDLMAFDYEVDADCLAGIIDECVEMEILGKSFPAGSKINEYILTSPYLEEVLAGLLSSREYFKNYRREKRQELKTKDEKKKELSGQKELPLVEPDHPLNVWIWEKLKYVSKMPNQLTNKNCVALLKRFDSKYVAEVLERMNNSGSIAKNKFVKKTFEDWAARDKKWAAEGNSGRPIAKPEDENKYIPLKK